MLPRASEKLLRQLNSRHGRRKCDVFLAEGVRCCAEAVRHRPADVRFALVAESTGCEILGAAPGFPVYQVSDTIFAEYAQTENPQGILLVMALPPMLPLPGCPDPFVLVLDRVQTPGNLGSILRSAVAVGLRQIAFTHGCVDPFNPKCIRAGMGAQFLLDFAAFPDLALLREHYANLGFQRLWITDVAAGVSCFDADFDLRGSLLVMGNEAHGAESLPGASFVNIPMSARMESLNVAQAATILIYQYAARHGIIAAS